MSGVGGLFGLKLPWYIDLARTVFYFAFLSLSLSVGFESASTIKYNHTISKLILTKSFLVNFEILPNSLADSIVYFFISVGPTART